MEKNTVKLDFDLGTEQTKIGQQTRLSSYQVAQIADLEKT